MAFEYNHNLQNGQNLIHYVGFKNKPLSEALKKYMAAEGIAVSTELPQLEVNPGYLTFKGDTKAELKIYPVKNGLDITYHQKKIHFSTSLSMDEAQKLIKDLLGTSQKTSLLNFIVSPVHAEEGILSTAGILVSGVAANVGMAALYGVAAVGEFFSDIAKEIKALPDSLAREKIIAACQDITEGKKVKDAEKLRVRLEKLKSDDQCVPEWEEFMYHSCKWYENHDRCLASASNAVANDKRDPKKSTNEGTATSNKAVKAINK